MQKILLFFSENLQTGIFLIDSCYVGGENINHYKFINNKEGDKIAYQLSYTLIPMGIEDSNTVFTKKLHFSKLFELTSKLGSEPQYTLSRLLTYITDANTESDESSKDFLFTNIPQIILPGGIAIQSLTTDKRVTVISNVLAKAQALKPQLQRVYNLDTTNDESNVIKIPKQSSEGEKPVVLLYPEIVNTKLRATANRTEYTYPLDPFEQRYAQSFDTLRQSKIWEGIPLTQEILIKNSDNIFKKIYQNTQDYAFINKRLSRLEALKGNNLLNQGFLGNFLNPFKELKDSLQDERHYSYPNIISTIPGEVTHFIKEIMVIPPSKTVFCGILRFLRDAFLDVAQRTSYKTFLIEKLSGVNDITPVLQAARAYDTLAPHPLEIILNDSNYLPLEKVRITTETQSSIFYFGIGFVINNTAWMLLFDPEATQLDNYIPWNFRKIDLDKYENKWKKDFDALTQHN